jgi:hypothetical protein
MPLTTRQRNPSNLGLPASGYGNFSKNSSSIGSVGAFIGFVVMILSFQWLVSSVAALVWVNFSPFP